jgi:hypothetical protein
MIPINLRKIIDRARANNAQTKKSHIFLFILLMVINSINIFLNYIFLNYTLFSYIFLNSCF